VVGSQHQIDLARFCGTDSPAKRIFCKVVSHYSFAEDLSWRQYRWRAGWLEKEWAATCGLVVEGLGERRRITFNL